MDFPVRVIPDASFDFFPPGGCSVLLVPFLGGSASVGDTILMERGVKLPWFGASLFWGGGGDPVKKRF